MGDFEEVLKLFSDPESGRFNVNSFIHILCLYNTADFFPLLSHIFKYYYDYVEINEKHNRKMIWSFGSKLIDLSWVYNETVIKSEILSTTNLLTDEYLQNTETEKLRNDLLELIKSVSYLSDETKKNWLVETEEAKERFDLYTTYKIINEKLIYLNNNRFKAINYIIQISSLDPFAVDLLNFRLFDSGSINLKSSKIQDTSEPINKIANKAVVFVGGEYFESWPAIKLNNNQFDLLLPKLDEGQTEIFAFIKPYVNSNLGVLVLIDTANGLRNFYNYGFAYAVSKDLKNQQILLETEFKTNILRIDDFLDIDKQDLCQQTLKNFLTIENLIQNENLENRELISLKQHLKNIPKIEDFLKLFCTEMRSDGYYPLELNIQDFLLLNTIYRSPAKIKAYESAFSVIFDNHNQPFLTYSLEKLSQVKEV